MTQAAESASPYSPESGVATGIVAYDNHRLVLRPHWAELSVRGRLRLMVFSALAAATLVLLWWRLTAPDIPYWQVLILWGFLVSLNAVFWAIQDTILVISDKKAVYRVRKFLLARFRYKKLLYRFQDISSVEIYRSLRPRTEQAIGDSSSPVFYIFLTVKNRRRLFWYTRFADSARFIAYKLSSLCDVPISDPERIFSFE